MESKQTNTPAAAGRGKSRWSAVDTLILLMLLAVIAGLIYRVVITVTAESEKGALYEVSFEVMETHRDVLAEVRAFDEVYLVENDMRLGAMGCTIVDESTGTVAPALTIEHIPDSDMATATGILVCRSAREENGNLMVEGTGRYLTSGSVLEIRTDRVIMTVRILSIDGKDAKK